MKILKKIVFLWFSQCAFLTMRVAAEVVENELHNANELHKSFCTRVHQEVSRMSSMRCHKPAKRMGSLVNYLN